MSNRLQSDFSESTDTSLDAEIGNDLAMRCGVVDGDNRWFCLDALDESMDTVIFERPYCQANDDGGDDHNIPREQ